MNVLTDAMFISLVTEIKGKQSKKKKKKPCKTKCKNIEISNIRVEQLSKIEDIIRGFYFI